MIGLILIFIWQTQACLLTRLSSRSNNYLLRNFDFGIGGVDGYGHVVLNPRNYLRTSFQNNTKSQASRWSAKYGSVTFNLIAEGLPQGGFNEAGLAVQTTVIRNRYRESINNENLPTITELDIVQFILDQCQNIEQVNNLFFFTHLKNNKQTSKVSYSMLTHVRRGSQILNYQWGICEASGKCALLEYLQGYFKLTNFAREELFIITNNPSDALSLEYEQLDVNNLPLEQNMITRSSFCRYANARFLTENYDYYYPDDDSDIEHHFNLLDSSTHIPWNKWQTIFDLTKKNLYFRSRGNLKIKEINLGQLNFNFDQPISLGLHTDGPFNQSNFVQLKLSQIRRQSREIASLMQNPINWGKIIGHHIELTRNGNKNGTFIYNLLNIDQELIQTKVSKILQQITHRFSQGQVLYSWTCHKLNIISLSVKKWLNCIPYKKWTPKNILPIS